MENWKKYEKTYFMPPEPCYDWVKKDAIEIFLRQFFSKFF